MPYADKTKYLECCRLAGRRWYRRNHEAQLARAARYREEKAAAEPTFRVRRSMQGNFVLRLKNLGVIAPPSLDTMLGVHWSFFVAHIEELFMDGQAWSNYGKAWVWHHCRPVNSFNLPRCKTDVLLVNHFPNLRPLSALEIANRSDKVFADDVEILRRNIAKA